MNLSSRSTAVASQFFRVWLRFRNFLPKRKCRSFGVQAPRERPKIGKIFVINLEREPDRWSKIRQELRQMVDSSGANLLSLAERYVAVDAKAFSQDPPGDGDVDPFYTLADQLFVEPQPLTLPARFELSAPIRMSRAEVAVARSHIGTWKRVAEGEHPYVLILEDDVWFRSGFEQQLDHAWSEVVARSKGADAFDVLYVSYVEAKHGAPKLQFSRNLFRPMRGLWHLSGYILSRIGAQKLLRMLPCRGPVDLWINRQFDSLNVMATRRSLVSQRRDARSTNSYSILPALSSIGAINSESASLFNVRPATHPVFAFGPEGSGLTSLAMALSMLGYRCCSDLRALPAAEHQQLLERGSERVFDAYVNIASLEKDVGRLRRSYPEAKFILTSSRRGNDDRVSSPIKGQLLGTDCIEFDSASANPWQAICEHLKCAPPAASFPLLIDLGQRPVVEAPEADDAARRARPKWDESPWVADSRRWWRGIHSSQSADEQLAAYAPVRIRDSLAHLDDKIWMVRSDTFTDNLALFRPANVVCRPSGGAVLSVRSELLGVRDFSAASLCTRGQFLFGRFTAVIRASDVPGVVTGFFLHRNSPRQEIDVEIAGNRPNHLLVNVFFNPGAEGAKFDYGYRGTPVDIELGFDASRAFHRFTIEWNQCEIRWLVDDQLVHRRVMWEPTPIPHLPMALHVNSWPSRSRQLAGRLRKRLLPATVVVESIDLSANLSRLPLGRVDEDASASYLEPYPEVVN